MNKLLDELLEFAREIIRRLREIVPQSNNVFVLLLILILTFAVILREGIINPAYNPFYNPAYQVQTYKISFDEVCNNKEIKGNHPGIGRPEYVENSAFWSVFNWKCNYDDKNLIGVNLDVFCVDRKGDDWRAYFYNYKNKDSWFCVEVAQK